MDKYTVDLDKVLNDFEYSELTDQNSLNASLSQPPYVYSAGQPAGRYDAGYEQPPHAKSGSAVKHSMNNVFHSLNEYLNTEVKTEVDEPPADVSDVESNISLLRQSSRDLPTIEDIFKNVTKDRCVSNAYRSHNVNTGEAACRSDFIDNLQPERAAPKVENGCKNTNLYANLLKPEKVDNSDALDQNRSKVDNLTAENGVHDKCPQPTATVVDDLLVSIDSDGGADTPPSSAAACQDYIQPDLLGLDVSGTAPDVFATLDLISTENPTEEAVDTLDSSETVLERETIAEGGSDGTAESSDVAKTEVTGGTESLAIVEPQVELANVVEEHTEEPIAQSAQAEAPSVSQPVKASIGFDDLSDMSDTEVEMELAQLEEEYQSCVEHQDETPGGDSTETEARPEVEADKAVIEAGGTEICDSAGSGEVEEAEVTVEQDGVGSEEASGDAAGESTEGAGEGRSSLQRPNSLDIVENAPNSAIDLIGAPGSTPYNNVYAQQAAPARTGDQESTALSPTTSEVSTSENSDSAGTDSCNDTSPDNEETGAAGASSVTQQQQQQPQQRPQGAGDVREWLGRTAPFWTPDSEAVACMHCCAKFTVVKRRHHCRACGLVLCSKCCHLRARLHYMDNAEARVCVRCHDILATAGPVVDPGADEAGASEPAQASPRHARLHPNNPMDYCSVVPPLQQVSDVPSSPPVVMVPVGVLKRKGSAKGRSGKSVMFCDGIRPGCDLTELDHDFNYREGAASGAAGTAAGPATHRRVVGGAAHKPSNRNVPALDAATHSFIPSAGTELPPTVTFMKTDISYSECENSAALVERLRRETVTFALQRNLYVDVRIIDMDCCINKHAWCFSTRGLIAVGQDEIVVLLELLEAEDSVPKDMFCHLNNVYCDAIKGNSVTELGLSMHPTANFLGSKSHAGFLYTRATFQCVQKVLVPHEPYLIGILIHRWESPWAKIFPLRLLLRLGAEYRYYPSPIISTRHRDSVYVEIGHTIINLLADFRNFSYTLPAVRGLTIHMQDKNTTVSIPGNRYGQVMKALNNSSDYILAFAANFSPEADSHLVCIQDVHGSDENTYTTHAINIQNKPRKVTGASFIVLNGALKSNSGLTAKSSIVEDGLMVQILPEQMVKLRAALRNMKDFRINCGCVNAQSDESVSIVWTGNDVSFNLGVVSPIDGTPLSGVPSIRVHNSEDNVCNSGNKLIRWTEVFILQSGDDAAAKVQDPVDISKLSDCISKATSHALVKFLDLLAANDFQKIGIRTTLHVDSVSYSAGSNGVKLPPIYMKSLDDELIPVLHKITMNNLGDSATVLELIFHILNA